MYRDDGRTACAPFEQGAEYIDGAPYVARVLAEASVAVANVDTATAHTVTDKILRNIPPPLD